MSRVYLDRTWRDPRQHLRNSPVHGTGAFANAPIRIGEVVERIGGVVMTNEEFTSFASEASRYNAVQIGEHLHLVERLTDTESRAGGSLNHSCDSNLWLEDEVTLVARRDIVIGEELTVDYALFTASRGWELDLPCRCGSPVCRGRVAGDDWKRPDVQQRYAGHFSPFINARIERLSG